MSNALTFFLSILRSFIVLSVLLSLSLTGCGKKVVVESKEPPMSDQFGGKTVKDGVHAQGLVMTRLENAPTSGQKAPNSELIDADSGKAVRLSELWKQKPLVLIFGSGSCSSSNLFSSELNALSKRFEKDASFAFIYIREAHPEGGFKLPLEGGFAKLVIPSIADSTTIVERCDLAHSFKKRGGPNMRLLVDSLSDSAAIRWGAWPARIFVVDTNGTVVYAGDQGPWFFSVTREGWHDPPPTYVEEVLKKRSFDRISLEEFLETRFGDSVER